jgi:hypothetical protein
MEAASKEDADLLIQDIVLPIKVDVLYMTDMLLAQKNSLLSEKDDVLVQKDVVLP